MTKLIVIFLNFANVPEKLCVLPINSVHMFLIILITNTDNVLMRN